MNGRPIYLPVKAMQRNKDENVIYVFHTNLIKYIYELTSTHSYGSLKTAFGQTSLSSKDQIAY